LKPNHGAVIRVVIIPENTLIRANEKYALGSLRRRNSFYQQSLTCMLTCLIVFLACSRLLVEGKGRKLGILKGTEIDYNTILGSLVLLFFL
jgi:hypothetical protein